MNIRKIALPIALSLIGMPATVHAEIITNYTEGFETPLDVTDAAFHPFGWFHSVHGPYSKNATYIYHQEGGRTGACIEGIQVPKDYSWDSDYNDLLITPPVTGESSVWIKATEAGSSVKFFSIGNKLTYYDNRYECTDMGVAVPELTVGEWVEVPIPAVDNARIGIRLDKAMMDDFTAAEANVSAYQELVITSARLLSSYNVAGDPDNRFEIKYNITLQNKGEVDYQPGDENYTFSHYLFVSGSIKYLDYSIGDIPIPEPLAAGETKTMEVTATLTVTDQPFTSNQLEVYENVTGSHTSYFTSLTYKPYVPEMTLINKASSSKYQSISAYGEPYHPVIQYGVVSDDASRSVTASVKNVAPLAPLTITAINTTAGFEANCPQLPIVVEAGDSIDVTINFTSQEKGVHTGTLTVDAEEINEMQTTLVAAVDDPDVWHEGFEDGVMPAGFLSTDPWTFNDMPEGFAREGHEKTLSIDYSKYSFITPKLRVTDGESLVISGYSFAYGSTTISVAYSTDRVNWETALNTSSNDNPAYNRFSTDKAANKQPVMSVVATDAIPAGEWFVKIEADRINIDEIYGYHATEPGNDLYLKSSTIPATGKVNYPVTASATVVNLGLPLDENSYTATLYVGETALATAATPAFAQGDELTFECEGVAHESGDLDSHIELAVGNNIFSSATSTIAIAEETAGENVTIGGMSSTSEYCYGPVYAKNNQLTEYLYTSEQLLKYHPGMQTGDKIGAITYYGKFTGGWYSEAKTFTTHVSLYIENTEMTMFEESPNSSAWSTKYIPANRDELLKVYEGDITVEPTDNVRELFTLQFNEPIAYTGGSLHIIITAEKEYDYNADSNPAFCYDYMSNKYTLYDRPSDLPYNTALSGDNYLPTIGLEIIRDVATLGGTVTNHLSGEPIEGVTVRAEAEGDVYYETVTDANGLYAMNIYQPEKQYKVKAYKQDHIPYESDSFIDIANLEANHDIEMSNLTDALDKIAANGIKITSGAGYIEVSAPVDTEIVIADLTGRVIASEKLTAGMHRYQLSAGVYIINHTKIAVK